MLYQYGLPDWINNFRENTKNQKTMPGVTFPTFVCRKCKTSKSTNGRKMVTPGYPRDGFLCKECFSTKKGN